MSFGLPTVDPEAKIHALYQAYVAKMQAMEKDWTVAKMCRAFTEHSEALSAIEKTKFAQLLLSRYCYCSVNLDLARFFLGQMEKIDCSPADREYEHPIAHQLAHQSDHPCSTDDSKDKLLLLLLKHPCYKPYIHSPEYTDKYGLTVLGRYLISKYHWLKDEDTPLRGELKKLFPEEYAELAMKAIFAGRTLDPVITFTNSCGRPF